MASWEFLLQREGDNSWLSLESPDVEILEGRYRMVSRSGYTNTTIAVRIVYQDLDQVPPVQQAQTRTLTTNSDGLMVLMPFTSLKPGLWQFTCNPQLSSGLLTTVGRKTVQLRVLPQEADVDHPFDEPQTRIFDTETPPTAPEPTEEQSAKVVQFPTARLSPPSDASEPPQLTISLVPPPSPTPEPSPEPQTNFELLLKSLQLTLEQESFVAKLGQALIVSGRVEQPPSTPEHPQSSYSLIPAPQLQIHISDPQTGNRLFEVSQTLPPSSLPLCFSSVVYIPFECKTRLILGEVLFCNDGVSATSQSFNIVTQVEHLLDAIDTNFGTEAEQDDFPEVSTLELTNLDLPELTEAKPVPQPTVTPLSSETAAILPPKIQSSSPASRPAAGLSLPTFEPRPTTPEEKTQPTAIPLQTSPSSEGEEPTPETNVPTPFQLDQPPKPQASPEVQQAFQALDLNNRFWSRLNALAQDQEWSQWIKRANTPPLPDLPFAEGASNLVRRAEQPASSSEGNVSPQTISLPLESEEIVVDDEPLEATGAFLQKRKPLKTIQPETSSTHSTIPYLLPEDQPIPEPQLEVLGTEITAGRPVKVRVRLPDNLPRIYIKIWVFDRQSRSVVDGPRWLTEFSPNAFEQIETTVDLEIPYSSLEVQFEAIAVEMQTQRESNKITLERSVTLPPPPSLPL